MSRILVLFYLPLALHIRSQQKQARENARNGNAFVNATRRKNILNAGRQTLAHNLSLTLAWEPSASILSGGNMSLAWIKGSRINAKYVGTYAASLFFLLLLCFLYIATSFIYRILVLQPPFFLVYYVLFWNWTLTPFRPYVEGGKGTLRPPTTVVVTGPFINFLLHNHFITEIFLKKNPAM